MQIERKLQNNGTPTRTPLRPSRAKIQTPPPKRPPSKRQNTPSPRRDPPADTCTYLCLCCCRFRVPRASGVAAPRAGGVYRRTLNLHPPPPSLRPLASAWRISTMASGVQLGFGRGRLLASWTVFGGVFPAVDSGLAETRETLFEGSSCGKVFERFIDVFVWV